MLLRETLSKCIVKNDFIHFLSYKSPQKINRKKKGMNTIGKQRALNKCGTIILII